MELEDPILKINWIVDAQRLKPYVGGESYRNATNISLKEV